MIRHPARTIFLIIKNFNSYQNKLSINLLNILPLNPVSLKPIQIFMSELIKVCFNILNVYFDSNLFLFIPFHIKHAFTVLGDKWIDYIFTNMTTKFRENSRFCLISTYTFTNSGLLLFKFYIIRTRSAEKQVTIMFINLIILRHSVSNFSLIFNMLFCILLLDDNIPQIILYTYNIYLCKDIPTTCLDSMTPWMFYMFKNSAQ